MDDEPVTLEAFAQLAYQHGSHALRLTRSCRRFVAWAIAVTLLNAAMILFHIAVQFPALRLHL